MLWKVLSVCGLTFFIFSGDRRVDNTLIRGGFPSQLSALTNLQFL